MTDFWISSGHHLLDRAEGGGLVVTDAFLRAYYARPELVPPPDAEPAEHALHRRLLDEPRRPVADLEIAALADPDARENWRLMLDFRARLLGRPTLEATYLDLFRAGPGTTPPLFVDQLTQLVLRNALGGCEDPFVLRAGELFFRPQRLSAGEAGLLLADEEIVERHEKDARPSPLLAMFAERPFIELDVLNEESATTYWRRSDSFDLVFDFTDGRGGRDALARVIERWIGHLLAVEVRVEPRQELRDEPLTWFIGLDAQATAIGNAIWRGEPVAAETSVLGLFQLKIVHGSVAPDHADRRSVILIMAATPERRVRLKPQNLVMNLPLPTTARA